MAKKKKSSLPAVARPFATASVPKKVAPVLEPPVELNEPEKAASSSLSSNSAATQDGANVKANGSSASSIAVNENGVTSVPEDDEWEKEEKDLQGLVEKLQEKVDKEVSRGLKAIDFEKRQAKAYGTISISPSAVQNALNIIKLSTENEPLVQFSPSDSEKLLLRLAISHGILTKLGFDKERVEECLRKTNSWELEDCFEWLFLHCSEDEVLHLGDWAPSKQEVSNMPPTPFSPSFANKTPRTVPASPSIDRVPRSPQVHSAPAPAVKSRMLTYTSATSTPDVSDSDEDDKIDDLSPSLEWAKLRVKLDALGGGVKPVKGNKKKPILSLGVAMAGHGEEAAKIKRKMDLIKASYLFNQKDADAEYRALSLKAQQAELEDRLAGKLKLSDPVNLPLLSETPADLTKTASISLDPQQSSSDKPVVDIFGQVEDDATSTGSGDGDGGFFGKLLDEMPASEVDSNSGTTITVRQMALPKHHSNSTPTPRSLLHTLVVKLDRYAVMDYNSLSGSFRACRSSLKIRWAGNREQEWKMDDTGCWTSAEADNFVATLALHELNVVEGKGEKGLWRQLPVVFKDLWDELDEMRKVEVDKEKRTVWSSLRSILDSRLILPQADPKSPIVKPTTYAKIPAFPNGLPPPSADFNLDTDSEEAAVSMYLKDSFERRQSSAAYQNMLEQRNSLPIAAYRQQIVDILDKSQILVLSGETGCGKSTQLPSFLLEDQLSKGKPCKIYVTEPRRISAISLAQRVSQELGDAPGQVGTGNSLVGYSIRLESCVSKNTRLAFVTNGIALRMLEGGSGPGGKGTAFDEITHIIVDEVHERSIDSDFLLIVLKSLMEQRKDLRVVLMSATVDAEKISDFFGGCPTLSVPGRTFPVTTMFLEDALEYSQWSINADSPYARRWDKFGKVRNKMDWNEDAVVEDDDEEGGEKSLVPVKLEKKYGPKTVETVNLLDERLIPYDLINALLEKLCFGESDWITYSQAILIFLPGLNEIRRMNDILQDHQHFGSDAFRIFPLHSTISSENQGAVFNAMPPGVRKIVISTNIAETGVTIPDITCVIDTGKHREMRFDEKRQISKLVECYIAKSNASQRRGRAGRVQNGLAFHLFTKLKHDTQLQDHPLPEMLRLSLQDLALRIKILKIKLGSSIEDVLSKALDPPLALNIQRAVSSLVEVKALTSNEEITPMGRLLSKLPMDVHLGKFLLIAALFKCLDPALTIAAALNGKSPFVAPFGLEQEADRAKASFKVDNSDFLTLHNAFSSWRRASANPGFVRQFCRKNYLSHQNLQQIEELRQQLFSYLVDSGFVEVSDYEKVQINRARFSRNKSKFLPIPPALDVNSASTFLISSALACGLFPKILSVDPQTGQLRTFSNNQPASLHPSSVNFRTKVADFGTDHLVFFTIMFSKRLYAWETGPVETLSLLLLCGELDFKLTSCTVYLDRKIKLVASPQVLLALKHLRSQINSAISSKMRNKMTDSQSEWLDLGLKLLRHDPEPEQSQKSDIISSIV